jgi:putative transcriptional regulator
MNDTIKMGSVLIAEPFLNDTFFHRAVVLVCEHDDDAGTIGFCLNKPLDVTINDVVDDFPELDAQVFCGGPLRRRALFFLHNLGDLLADSKFVSPGVWWGVNFDALKTLVSQGLVSPERIRFFVGYSSWAEHQLSEEMQAGAWVTTEMDSNYMFKVAPEQLWKRTLENKGSNFAIIAGIPDTMNLN